VLTCISSRAVVPVEWLFGGRIGGIQSMLTNGRRMPPDAHVPLLEFSVSEGSRNPGNRAAFRALLSEGNEARAARRHAAAAQALHGMDARPNGRHHAH
jgi:hypothetical protein